MTAFALNFPENMRPSSFLDAAPGTHKYVWAPSLWPVIVTTNATVGTGCLTIGIPDDFYAVRVGYMNAQASTYTVTKTVAVPSTTWANYVTPTGTGLTQTTLTTNGAGADNPQIYYGGGTTSSLTVLGNATDASTGRTDKPKISWTDWTPMVNTTPDPTNNMRILMLRYLVPASQSVTFANGTFTEYSGAINGNQDIHGGMDVFIGGVKTLDRSAFPYSSDPQTTATTTTWAGNRVVNGNLMAIVQVMTKNKGIVICQIGDSKQGGTNLPVIFNNYALRAIQALNQRYAGQVPFGYINYASGGFDSARMFGLSRDLMTAISPSMVHVPLWTENEDSQSLGYVDAFSGNLFLSRAMEMAAYVRSLGAIPILSSPIPMVGLNNAYTSAEANMVASFATACRTFAAIRDAGNELTVDLFAACGGDYNNITARYGRSEYTTDGRHPNTAGNQIMIQPFLDATVKSL